MSRRVQVIGIPYGHGGVGEGCKLGPDAIRQAGLKEHVFPEAANGDGYTSEERYVTEYDDAGDLPVDDIDDADLDELEARLEDDDLAVHLDPERYDFDSFIDDVSKAEIVDEDDGRAKHLDHIAVLWDVVAERVAKSIEDGYTPVVVGGDHTVATGTIRGAARDAERLGIIWLDAHGDYNTPLSSPSGNVHGMPLGAALGRGPFGGKEWAEAENLDGNDVFLVGLRALDHELPDRVEASDRDLKTESEAIREDLKPTTMADIDERGIDEVMDEVVEEVDENVDQVHVSVDLDWLDSSVVKGVGTPVDQGATLREARRAMEILAEKNEEADGEFIRSIEFVEANPLIDEHGNGTAEIAAELAGATFGERFIYG